MDVEYVPVVVEDYSETPLRMPTPPPGATGWVLWSGGRRVAYVPREAVICGGPSPN